MRLARRWRSVEAELARTAAGPLEFSAASSCVVSMLVGRPVRALWRSESGFVSALRVAGDVDIVAPGDHIALEHDRATELLNVTLSESLVTSAAASMSEGAGVLPVATRTHVRDPRLQYVVWALKEELTSSDQDDFGEALGRALALRLVSAYASVPYGHHETHKADLDCMLEYIDEHLDSDLTLVEIARVGCVSVDNLKRLFRATLGVSAHRYIVQRRVAYAASLLRNGKWPLKEIALRSGFYDQSHMTRWMRRVTGMTPADVRTN